MILDQESLQILETVVTLKRDNVFIDFIKTYDNGDYIKYYYYSDKLVWYNQYGYEHRLDGPAIITNCRQPSKQTYEWRASFGGAECSKIYANSQEELNKLIKLKVFL